MRDRDDVRPVRGARRASVSLERRRVCRWLLVPAAQLVVPCDRVGRGSEDRVRAACGRRRNTRA